MKLNQQVIKQDVGDHFPGKVIVKDQVTSTQEVAKNIQVGNEPVVVLAEKQTNGHGKGQRQFYSPRESGLYLSILLPNVKAAEMPRCGLFTTGLANSIVTILQKYYPGKQLGVKWVNDILLGQLKVGGILVEAQIEGSQINWIVGIGINLFTDDFPENIHQRVGSLSHDKQVDRDRLAADIIAAVWQLKQNYQQGKYLDEYQRRLVLMNKTVSLQLADTQITGIVKGVDRNGRLLIEKDDGEIQPFNDGEVVKVHYKKWGERGRVTKVL